MSVSRLTPRLRSANDVRHVQSQPQRRHASILFALSALSNSRETQHFRKATKLSPVEHSPALKLIQSSEVDPFKPPPEAKVVKDVPPKAETMNSLHEKLSATMQQVHPKPNDHTRPDDHTVFRRRSTPKASATSSASTSLAQDVGRAYMRDQAWKQERLRRKIRYLESTEHAAEKQANRRVVYGSSMLNTIMLMSIGGGAVYIFSNANKDSPRDSAQRAREITAAADARAEAVPVAAALPAAEVSSVPIPSTRETLPEASLTLAAQQSGKAWWQSLFWK